MKTYYSLMNDDNTGMVRWVLVIGQSRYTGLAVDVQQAYATVKEMVAAYRAYVGRVTAEISESLV